MNVLIGAAAMVGFVVACYLTGLLVIILTPATMVDFGVTCSYGFFTIAITGFFAVFANILGETIRGRR